MLHLSEENNYKWILMCLLENSGEFYTFSLIKPVFYTMAAQIQEQLCCCNVWFDRISRRWCDVMTALRLRLELRQCLTNKHLVTNNTDILLLLNTLQIMFRGDSIRQKGTARKSDTPKIKGTHQNDKKMTKKLKKTEESHKLILLLKNRKQIAWKKGQ